MNPTDRRYTTEHEWIKAEGEHYVVGITAFAQDQLGDIVYVELPKVGALIEQGKSFAVVESVKAASEIYAPVSGEVVAANDALSTAPETLNSDPHGTAWIAKIKLSAPEEVDRLLSPADYQAFLGAE